MRTNQISYQGCSDAAYFVGYQGEQNFIALEIFPPDELAQADFFYSRFSVPGGTSPTAPLYLEDGKLSVTLWAQVTNQRDAQMTLEGYYGDPDGEHSRIGKAPMITLRFEESVMGDLIPPSGDAGSLEYTVEQLDKQAFTGATESDTGIAFQNRVGETVAEVAGGTSGNSPYVNATGTWMQYDDSTQQWVDTGVLAEGPTGPPGEPGPQGEQGPKGDGSESVKLPIPLVFDSVSGADWSGVPEPTAAELETWIAQVKAGDPVVMSQTITDGDQTVEMLSYPLTQYAGPFEGVEAILLFALAQNVETGSVNSLWQIIYAVYEGQVMRDAHPTQTLINETLDGARTPVALGSLRKSGFFQARGSFTGYNGEGPFLYGDGNIDCPVLLAHKAGSDGGTLYQMVLQGKGSDDLTPEIKLYAANIRGIQEMTVLTDAPNDGKQYARQNGQWVEITGGGA